MTAGMHSLPGAAPETPEPAGRPEPWTATRVVGKPLPRVDAYERVSGSAVYPSDVVLPGMLYGAILRCPHPHARVKSLDASGAESMPGVRAVLTPRSPEADLPWEYSGSIRTRLLDEHLRHEGEDVAAVAADTPYQAWDAVRAIRVEYEVLPFVVDDRKALNPDSPRVGDEGNLAGKPQTYSRGDVEKGFREADVVLEREYRTECELHTTLEPHACVARWDGDDLTVWESTQGVFAVQGRLAQALRLPLSRVRVIGLYMGGGFGSKLQAGKYTILAALLARKTGRPVKLVLTREETFLAVGNRPPSTMRLKMGVKKDGTLTALEFKGVGASGAYPAGGTSLLDWEARDLYACPNVRTETTDVLIHAGPARPMRAPGHPQCSWALEQMMDDLAEAIGMDPVELRLRNVPQVSQGRDGSPPYTTTGLAACIREGAKAFGWEESRKRPRGEGHLKRGVGMGACLWIAGAGGPPASIIVKVLADGSVSLNMGASDIGTGTKTIMAMVVAEELGAAPGDIRIENADTGTTLYATPSGGSKTVPTEAPAVRDAALDAKRQLLEAAAADLKVPAGDLVLEGGVISSRESPEKRKKVTEVEGLRRRGAIVGMGYRGPNPSGVATCPFGAQFCEVEVNTLTGEVRLLRFLAAQDSGRVMNRRTFDNQVWGGITMGIGLALTEARVLDDGQTGKMVNANWHDYKLPTALDVPPELTSLPIEVPDDAANSTGAKGLGEPVTIPTAAAIANAVHHATGARVPGSPISPARLLEVLAGKRKEG